MSNERGLLARALMTGSLAGLATTVGVALAGRRETGRGGAGIFWGLVSPGWDLRLSQRSVGLGFATLGLSLAVAALVRARR